MINIGIVGFGHVVINQHFPILSCKPDINISWVVEPNKNQVGFLEKMNIPVIDSIEYMDNYETVDIVLITSPYGTRQPIYSHIKNNVKGIYCEKPFAKSVEEHLKTTEGYSDHCFGIGYNRRALGNVNLIKKIIEDKIFGELQAIKCQYSYFRVSSGSFHSDVKLAGGGILFESGVHWIDSMLYSIDPDDLNIIDASVQYNDGLDIHNEARFDIQLNENRVIDCEIIITHLQETEDKITYIFEDLSLDLYLYNETKMPIIYSNKDRNRIYEINNFVKGMTPSTALGQGIKFWDDYLFSFMNNEISYTNASQSILTTKVVEQIYNS